jgi:hypothetical protein
VKATAISLDGTKKKHTVLVKKYFGKQPPGRRIRWDIIKLNFRDEVGARGKVIKL